MSGEWPEADRFDRWAWSCYGGDWRRVDIKYRLGYDRPEPLWLSILTGSFVAFFTGALAIGCLVVVAIQVDHQLRQPSGGWTELLVFGGIVGLLGLGLGWIALANLRIAFTSVRDLGQRVTIQGMVFHFRKPRFNKSATPVAFGRDRYAAVDEDGRSGRVEALFIPTGELERGDLIRATVSPRRRHVYDFDVIALQEYAEPVVVTWGAETMGVAVATAPAPWVVPQFAVPQFYSIDEEYVQYATGLPMTWVDREEHHLRQRQRLLLHVSYDDDYQDAAGNELHVSILYARAAVSFERVRREHAESERRVDGLGVDSYWNEHKCRLSVLQDARRVAITTKINTPPEYAFTMCMLIARRMLTGQ